MATGTVVVTETKTWDTIKEIVWEWTSTAGGAAGDVTTKTWTGAIIDVIQVPSGGAAPSNLYDVVITDENGADVIGGNGANIAVPGVTIKTTADGLGSVCNSTLTLAVTNAGAAKSGTTILHIR